MVDIAQRITTTSLIKSVDWNGGMRHTYSDGFRSIELSLTRVIIWPTSLTAVSAVDKRRWIEFGCLSLRLVSSRSDMPVYCNGGVYRGDPAPVDSYRCSRHTVVSKVTTHTAA